MKKIPTLFVRDTNDRRYVTPQVTPGCEWVPAGEGTATRKYDGTCVAFDGERWWARREVKPGKEPPQGFRIEEHDEVTGKTVGWEPAAQSSFYPFLLEAVGNVDDECATGTYELCGPKINRNPEGYTRHTLVHHAGAERYPALNVPQGYDDVCRALTALPWEGIVWHHPDGRMAKLKRRDFPLATVLAVCSSAAINERTSR